MLDDAVIYPVLPSSPHARLAAVSGSLICPRTLPLGARMRMPPGPELQMFPAGVDLHSIGNRRRGIVRVLDQLGSFAQHASRANLVLHHEDILGPELEM